MKKIILTTLSLLSSFVFLNNVGHMTYENKADTNAYKIETTRVPYLAGEVEGSTLVDLEYEFSFESGATFTYDGTGEEPNIKVTVLSEGAVLGVDYDWYFTYDDENDVTHQIGQTIPTTPGTYGLTIKVSNSDKYNDLRDFRWFRIKAPKAEVDIQFSFTNGASFAFDGTGDAPDFSVIVPEGVTYTTYFEKDGKNIGTDIPTTPGTYSFICETEENDTYNSKRDWRWFRIILVKQEVQIDFSINNGDTFAYDGTGDAPDFSVTVPEGVTYTTYFEKDGVNIGTDIPTTPGTYSFICETEENDTYNSKRDWRWFRITSPSLVDPEITFGEELSFVWDGSNHTPTYNVPSDSTYSIHYEQNEKFYSYDAPSDPGTYALIVSVTKDNKYNADTKWVVFRIKYTKESFITEWKTLRSNSDQSICSYISTDADTYDNLIAKMTTYNFSDDDINWIKEQDDIEGVTIGETMAYIENARLVSNSGLSSSVNLINYESQSTLLCTVILTITGIAFITVYFLYKKKNSLN